MIISGLSLFLKRLMMLASYFLAVPYSSIMRFQKATSTFEVSPNASSSPSRVSGEVMSTSDETMPISSRYCL